MINFLQLKGNKNTDIVVTHNKGVSADGIKHPHSWSIMEPEKCMARILKQMK